MAHRQLKSPRWLSGRSSHLNYQNVTVISHCHEWPTHFCSMSIALPILNSGHQNLTLTIHSQGHACGQRSRSHITTCFQNKRWWRNGVHGIGSALCWMITLHGDIGGRVYQTQVTRAGTSNYIPQYLWYLITCPCLRYLVLAHKSTFMQYFTWTDWCPISEPRQSAFGPSTG